MTRRSFEAFVLVVCAVLSGAFLFLYRKKSLMFSSSPSWTSKPSSIASSSTVDPDTYDNMDDIEDWCSGNDNKLVKKRTIKFIPFPHKPLGSGESVTCNWSTYAMPPLDDDLMCMLSNNSNSNKPDVIQLGALREGMCLGKSLSSLHVFSTAEAIECLSPTAQNDHRPVMLALAGDSYTIQFFIGLLDVLLGRPTNDEIKNYLQRREVLNQTMRLVEAKHLNQPFPDIRFVCAQECYGQFEEVPFHAQCSQCLRQLASSVQEKNNHTHLAMVVGAGIHIFASHKSNLTQSVGEIRQFLAQAPKPGVIFTSMPNYNRNYIPIKYRNATHHVKAGDFHDEMKSLFFPYNPHQPFLDFHEMTKACTNANCSYDGGHRSRYVNRWKAQLLLNTICEVSTSTTTGTDRGSTTTAIMSTTGAVP